MIYSFTVMGVPVPKRRPRFARVGKFVTTFTPKETTLAEKNVAKCFSDKYNKHKVIEDKPICLRVIFYMPISKSLSKKKQNELLGKDHTKKPDCDNLIKVVCDGLNGVAWKDDSQISYMSCSKVYDIMPRTEVLITTDQNNS